MFEQNTRFEMISFCFDKCVDSFKEKPLNPYERECVYPCIESQANLLIELHNNKLAYENFRRDNENYLIPGEKKLEK